MRRVLIGSAVLLLAACGGDGGIHDELVQQCDKQLNVGTEMCECIADKADEDLTPEGRKFVLASLQDDKAGADAIRPTLGFEELVKAGMFMVNAPAQCAAEKAG